MNAKRRCWPLLILIMPGCTFYDWGNGGVKPRSAADLKDISPATRLL